MEVRPAHESTRIQGRKHGILVVHVDEENTSKTCSYCGQIRVADRMEDCVPRIKRADDEAILVETYVSDRTVINELVDQLKSATERVSLCRLTTRQRSDGTIPEQTTVDPLRSPPNSGRQRRRRVGGVGVPAAARTAGGRD